MYLLEGEQWLSKGFQKHQSSVIYSFIFIHSARSELTKTCIQCTAAFIRKEVGGTPLVFQKGRFQGFISEILRVIGLLGEKLIVSSSPGTTELFRIFRLSVYIHDVLPVNYAEEFELCFYFKYSRSYEGF